MTVEKFSPKFGSNIRGIVIAKHQDRLIVDTFFGTVQMFVSQFPFYQKLAIDVGSCIIINGVRAQLATQAFLEFVYEMDEQTELESAPF